MDDYLSRKSRLTVWSSTIRHNLEKNAASVGNPGVRPVRYPAHFSTSTHRGTRNQRKKDMFCPRPDDSQILESAWHFHCSKHHGGRKPKPGSRAVAATEKKCVGCPRRALSFLFCSVIHSLSRTRARGFDETPAAHIRYGRPAISNGTGDLH